MTPHPRTRFRLTTLYRHKELHPMHFASRRYSFWLATFTVFTFIVGNMVGQHGWYGFWHSVLGKADDSMIVFTGTVEPIDKVPDLTAWSQYGGDIRDHTYRMIPSGVLIDLPYYDTAEQRKSFEDAQDGDIYMVGYMGSYDRGGEYTGSHAAVDIALPVGTPIRSIANGIVDTVRELQGGFGKYVVVRYPNVPSMDGDGTTTYYGSFAHMDSIVVTEGMIVNKGQIIGTSGKTGLATGPHLHFQIDKEDAPFHPYWPFTSSEASAAGYSFWEATNAGLHSARGERYTVNPMLFVQQNENKTYIATADTVTQHNAVTDVAMTPQERRDARRDARLAQYIPSSSSVSSASSATPTLVANSTDDVQHFIPSTTDDAVSSSSQSSVSSPSSSSSSSVSSVPEGRKTAYIEIAHDGRFHRSWEKIFITAYDEDGNIVKTPTFDGTIYLRSAFGSGEFRPSQIAADDFSDGTAEINVLPNATKRSFVIETKGAFEAISRPMEYDWSR